MKRFMTKCLAVVALVVSAGCVDDARDEVDEGEPTNAELASEKEWPDEPEEAANLFPEGGSGPTIPGAGCGNKTRCYCECLVLNPCTTPRCRPREECLNSCDDLYPFCVDTDREGGWRYTGPSNPTNLAECRPTNPPVPRPRPPGPIDPLPPPHQEPDEP